MNANVDALAIRPDTGLSRPALVTARHVVVASFLAWMLDACDFFIVLFTLDDVARGFGVSLQSVLLAPTLTLLTRPIGPSCAGGRRTATGASRS